MSFACTPVSLFDSRLDKEVTDDSRRTRLGADELRWCRSEGSTPFKRLLKVAESMALRPEASVNHACDSWGDTKAAYRLLNEADVTPDGLQGPHRKATRERSAADHPLVLVLQDASDLDLTFHNKTKGRGKIGNGKGRGLIQHTALAVEPGHGGAIGILHQSWHKRVERPEDETAAQRLARWRESDVWAQTIDAVGAAPSGTAFVHVMDSHGDCFNTFAAMRRTDVELVVRVMHYDRRLSDGTPLIDHLAQQPVLPGTLEVTLHEQRDGRNAIKHAQRSARLQARSARVTLPPTRGTHGGEDDQAPIELNAILLTELDPPAGEAPVRWMLLTTLPAATFDEVCTVARYYALRWRIEEFHRVEKEGCQVEDAQFDDVADIARLAAIKSVVAVRLLQLRDAAQAAMRDPAEQDTPQRLRQLVPKSWIEVVARVAKTTPTKLTVSQFYRRVAMRGGWLGRKSDGPPGWKTLWRGWEELFWMVTGYELGRSDAGRSG
jgi:hypothetical protein